jgi:hypothetical protein
MVPASILFSDEAARAMQGRPRQVMEYLFVRPAMCGLTARIRKIRSAAMKELLIALVLISPIVVIANRMGIDIPQAILDTFRDLIHALLAAAA